MNIFIISMSILMLLGSWVPILNNLSFFGAILLIGVSAVFCFTKFGKEKRSWFISSIVVNIITIGLVLFTQSVYSDTIDSVNESIEQSNEAALAANETAVVEFGEYTYEISSYDESQLTESNLDVNVTNSSEDTVYNYDIEIEALDNDGNQIATDNVYVENLSPGKTAKKDAFKLLFDTDKAESIVSFNVCNVMAY